MMYVRPLQSVGRDGSRRCARRSSRGANRLRECIGRRLRGATGHRRSVESSGAAERHPLPPTRSMSSPHWRAVKAFLLGPLYGTAVCFLFAFLLTNGNLLLLIYIVGAVLICAYI